MSTGPRIPLKAALAAAKTLTELWKLPAGAVVVGSVRRSRPDVGDLEFLVPMPEVTASAADDAVFQSINATVTPAGSSLFSGASAQCGVAERGVKPWFQAAAVRMQLRIDGVLLDLPVQVFRAPPKAWGWALLMRTGPGEFGKWVLWKWKEAHGTNRLDQGSKDGHLVDAQGVVVPVFTEAEIFQRLRIPFIAPEERDDAVARLMSTERREARGWMT